MKITAKLKKQIITASAEAYPDEMCGIVFDGEFIRFENASETPETHFQINPLELARYEDRGEIQAYVHSHPDGSATASPYDKIQIEEHKKPWIICSYPEIDIQLHEPCGYKAPLIGRNYYHGFQDCYSLVRDFYSRELNIELLDFDRDDKWWESVDNESMYLMNYKRAGFKRVDDLQYGDMIVCKVGRTEHPNHALIWLGDKTELLSEKTDQAFGTELILHHPYGQASKREIYGKNWQERTVMILRHKQTAL